jgi:hypothetical protein
MHERRHPGADDELWLDARPVVVGGVGTLALSPEDNLVHAIVHGMWRNALSPMRWVADAALIVRRTDAFDWTRLIDRVRARRVSVVVGRALRYLHDSMHVAVPPAALDRLDEIPVSLAERFEARARAMSGLPGQIAAVSSDWVRARAYEPEWRGMFGFPRYLRDVRRLESTSAVPAAICRKVWRRVRLGSSPRPAGSVRR